MCCAQGKRAEQLLLLRQTLAAWQRARGPGEPCLSCLHTILRPFKLFLKIYIFYIYDSYNMSSKDAYMS